MKLFLESYESCLNKLSRDNDVPEPYVFCFFNLKNAIIFRSIKLKNLQVNSSSNCFFDGNLLTSAIKVGGGPLSVRLTGDFSVSFCHSLLVTRVSSLVSLMGTTDTDHCS